jgi:hypothetical protein
MLGQATARYFDLVILPPARGVLALVVASEQEDDPVARGVAEHPQERRLAINGRLEAQSELEQPTAELAAELSVADADAIPL